jgi:predicted ATPase
VSGGPPQVFISYRRVDAPYAGRLADALAERLGAGQVFLDVDGIKAGEDFERIIVGAIERADVVLVVVGRQWATLTGADGGRRLDAADDFVRREIEAALARDVRVVPLLVQGATMPGPGDLPASIAAFARRQAVELTDRRWHADVADLVRAVAPDVPSDGAPEPTRPARDAAPPAAPPASGAVRPAALPQHRTRFLGREDDLTRIGELLATTGFVTVTGPGGVGKSRLALEAARARAEGYADGVAWAELAPIADPALVAAAVLRAADPSASEREATLDALADRLAERSLLLVLDNCEHVIDAAATLAEALARRCARLHLLATSREPLGVDGEAVWRLAPLPLGTDGTAAALFADRAALSDPAFTLDAASEAVVGRVVDALDGLPLAIELAAAALRSQPLTAVAEAVTSRFDVTGASRRTAEARQRTLSATIAWSYELLDPDEQLVLDRLGVFAGSFTVEAAVTVCGPEGPRGGVEPVLHGLVDRSLVHLVDAAGTPDPRLRLLHSVREFARARLAERPGDPTPAALVRWATEVAVTHGPAVDFGDERSGLAVLDAEHPNLLAALAVTLGPEAADGAPAGRLVAALTPYWEMRGLSAEGLRWAEQALARGLPDDRLRAAGLLAAGRLLPAGDFEGRGRRAAEALEVADRAGDDSLASAALATLGHIELENERRQAGRVLVEQALARAEAARDDARIAVAEMRLALCDQGASGPLASAVHDRLDRARALFRAARNRRGELWCLAELGFLSLTSGDLDQAAETFRAGLALGRELGYPHGEAWMLDALGEVAGTAGDFAAAREAFAAAHEIQVRLRDELNGGWSLGGLVRAHVRLGDVPGALAALTELARLLRGGSTADLHEYALVLRAGSVALAAGEPERAARLLGVLDGIPPTDSLSRVDHADRAELERAVGASPERAALAASRASGTAPTPLAAVEEFLAAGPRPAPET